MTLLKPQTSLDRPASAFPETQTAHNTCLL